MTVAVDQRRLPGRSARDAVRRSLRAIDAHDADLRACILVRRHAAPDEAEALDADPVKGVLHGWTIGVKDNMDVRGTVRSDGLAPPHPMPAAHDAAAVRRLRAAGAVIVAKTNLEEMSFGATTRNRHWGHCRNPWDRTRLAGGSSGGSAVAVASGMVTAALGTDAGGSLRNPASFCGISALRPSMGWVPVDGVTALSPDFDVVGPMARSARELRLVLAAVSARRPDTISRPPARVRIGIPASFFFDDLHPDVAAGCEALGHELAAAGATLASVALAGAGDTPEALGVLLNAQAADVHPEWLEDPRVAPGVRDRMLLGRSVTAQQHATATRVADRWRRTVASALEKLDALLVPTTPMPAPPLDDAHMVAVSRSTNRLNCAWSLARLPALSLPCATGEDGLPVGAQLVGVPGSDWRLLALAEAVQRRTDWHEQLPATGGPA